MIPPFLRPLPRKFTRVRRQGRCFPYPRIGQLVYSTMSLFVCKAILKISPRNPPVAGRAGKIPLGFARRDFRAGWPHLGCIPRLSCHPAGGKFSAPLVRWGRSPAQKLATRKRVGALFTALRAGMTMLLLSCVAASPLLRPQGPALQPAAFCKKLDQKLLILLSPSWFFIFSASPPTQRPGAAGPWRWPWPGRRFCRSPPSAPPGSRTSAPAG